MNAERFERALAREPLDLRPHRGDVVERRAGLAPSHERPVCAIASIGESFAEVRRSVPRALVTQMPSRSAHDRDNTERFEGHLDRGTRHREVVRRGVIERAVQLHVPDRNPLSLRDLTKPRELRAEGLAERHVVEAHRSATEPLAIRKRRMRTHRNTRVASASDHRGCDVAIPSVGAARDVDHVGKRDERDGLVGELAHVDVQSRRHRAVWSPPMTSLRKPTRFPRSRLRAALLAASAAALTDCGDADDAAPVTPARSESIPATTQRTGDAAAGYEYLRYGDFIGSGVPVDVFLQFFQGAQVTNELERTGDNAMLPRAFNAFDTTIEGHSVRVVGGTTCFGCHAGTINGRFIPGLGSTTANFTADSSPRVRLLDTLVRAQYGEDSPEWRAYLPFSRGAQAVGPFSTSPFQGVNGAFLLEDAAASHRDPLTLAWRDEAAWSSVPTMERPRIASDTPAWWLLRKKNALYYNGMGRGDFARMLMQVSVVAVRDSAQAQSILTHFGDVLAWLRELRPPTYPAAVNAALAGQGRALYEARCASCHGTYGEGGAYPNLLVPVATVGTDAAYAEQFMTPGRLTDWFNRSWYAGAGTETARMVPTRAYLAPPLDGVWATAPYLHNGSVPTLAALLESSTRPTRWRRDFASSTYDMNAVGWPFTAAETSDLQTYDTTRVGYGNRGHTFGDSLSRNERAALLEYLKTL